MSLISIVNQPSLYINGLEDAWASNTTLTVTSGICRDSTNQVDINLGNYLGLSGQGTANSSTTLNAAITGANGLDTGSLAASTWYYIFVISDSSNTNVPATLLSLSSTAPTLPFGYDVFLQVGYWLTDGSSHFLLAWVSGNGSSRKYTWDAPISVLSSGSASTLTAIDVSTAVPPIADNIPLLLDAIFTPATANDYLLVVAGNSTAPTGATL